MDLLFLIIVIAVFVVVIIVPSNTKRRITVLQIQLNELQKKVQNLELDKVHSADKSKTDHNVSNEILNHQQSLQQNSAQSNDITTITLNTQDQPITELGSNSNSNKESPQLPQQANNVFYPPQKISSTESDQTANHFISWLLKGNLVAKVAIIILFFGLSYLFKYSVEHGLLSPEIRVLGALVLGIVLLTVGWRLRHKKQLYALILQGGAIGILYLTIFAAFKLYDLVPVLLAFALLIVICGTSILFAILQRTMIMAIIASVGGYLAPILLSTGSGNHIALFSYYLMLSSAILVISNWQSWRLLNLIGFLFTFIVSLLWGTKSYQPEFYTECQIFILANMLIYGVLAVLLSIRSIRKEHYQYPIDLILLFGVPISGFALQYAITRQWEFGPAFSSLGFGLFYLVGAYITLHAWRKTAKTTSLLGLAIGLGFSSLAIPLAFTANWTALIWLFEGTALSWAMITQKQYHFAWFGTLITLLGVISGIISIPLCNLTTTEFITLFGIMSASLLFNACLWHYYRNLHNTSANVLKVVFIIIASIIWAVWILISLMQIMGTIPKTQPIILCFIISVWLWYFIGRKLKWDLLCYATLSLWPVLLLAILNNAATLHYSIKNIGLWSLVWPIAFISAYIYLSKAKLLINQLQKQLFYILHISLFWIMIAWLFNEVKVLLILLPWGFGTVEFSLLVTLASSIILVYYYLIKRRILVTSSLIKSYWLVGLLPIIIYLTYSLIIGITLSGQIIYCYYIPLLNPLEEGAIFAWMMLGLWLKLATPVLKNHSAIIDTTNIQKPLTNISTTVLIALAFLWTNSMVLRSLNEWLNLTWSFYSLWHTNIIQVVLSLIWTLTAVILVGIAHRYLLRKVWYAGVILQSVIVIKLVFVDSVELDGLLRAFVFIGVALLMLLIGYLAPLPPKIPVNIDKQQE
ncbi:DUF2339 domain-containing protein [Gilliamella sp. wkB112]|uniref:DUF2339 domain-containing protein n=1 Tax=Gilliamella sp. wkB112 TaxID=3120257 RepID=UPI00080EE4A2|nr:DUF2339 domain-containing protein [Gilliamella apicola]OCG01653.1 hypothetical protein A9G12_11770 [Gilliamella apicola]